MQESFTKAADYGTYSLKNRFPWHESKIASRVARMVKKLSSQLKGMDFDDIGPISILAFLKVFGDACDRIGIHEVATVWLVSFLENEAGVIISGSSLIAEDNSCN